MNRELLHLIGITYVPQVGAIKAKQLIAHCGSASDVFREKSRNLLKIPGIGERIVARIKDAEILHMAEKQIEFARKNSIQIITYLDPNYPSRLKHFEDSPVTLYFQGSADLNHYRTLAIIGTRDLTERGHIQTECIVEALKPYDVHVYSGLAYGIDITAHRKCVQMGIPTIGILGHGLDIVYPWSHSDTAEAMVSAGGLLTEFPINTNPDKENFPMRNRLIAGLSDAVLVVESAETGGSMITANLAFGYHRDVFAMPGRPSDSKSKGCNLLIKQNKAALAESAEDITSAMQWTSLSDRPAQTKLFPELEPEAQLLVGLMKDRGELHIDMLCSETGLPPGQVAKQLLSLEFGGIVRSLPGKRYLLV